MRQLRATPTTQGMAVQVGDGALAPRETTAMRIASLDGLWFSGTWVALAAAALTAATARAIAARLPSAAIALAFAGTFAVYGVDRLRDLARDARTSPRRTAFVMRHRRVMTAATAAAGVAAVGITAVLGAHALLPSLFAGGFGLLHRRFKRVAFFKASYVTAAWLAVVVGLPAATAASAPTIAAAGWACAILGTALCANAMAFSVRDGEAAAARLGTTVALRTGLAIALIGVAAGSLAPAPLRGLTAIPLATAAALAGFRADERYVHAVVDGALIAGALAALLLPR